jgi:hypothetical protein
MEHGYLPIKKARAAVTEGVKKLMGHSYFIDAAGNGVKGRKSL